MRQNILNQSKSAQFARISIAFLLILALTLSLVPSASGAPRFTMNTNNLPAEIDDEVKVRYINMASEIVERVSVSIKFEKMSQSSWPGCVAIGGSGHNGGSSYSDEISFRLVSPSGTNVDLVFDDDSSETYTNTSQYPGVVTVVFADDADKQVGGTIPVSGTFRPEEPFSKFIGEDAGGEWKLYAGDNEGSDPLCLYEWSLSVDSGWKDPSISGIYGGEKRCKLTAIDSLIYIGSDNYFTARGLGVPDKLRFAQDGVVAGFLYPSDYGFEDGKWKIVTNLQDANGLPMFEPGIYHVACFGPGGTTGTPLRTVISR
jgi:hypothetical protein